MFDQSEFFSVQLKIIMNNSSMEFKEWVEYLIKHHRKPIRKVEVNCLKEPGSSKANDSESLNQHLEHLKLVYDSPRVAIRSKRNKGNWLDDQQMTLITRKKGNKVALMGFENSQGKFITPFETLFLLETNRLELLCKEIPMSIQQAYQQLLQNNTNLCKYQAYRALVLAGLQLYDSKIKDRLETCQPTIKKPKLCLEGKSTDKDIERTDKEDKHGQVLRKMQDEGPSSNCDVIDYKCDYFIKKNKCCYNLYFMTEPELDSKIGFYDAKTNNQNIFALVSNKVAFLKAGSVNLPDLS